jgi:DNA-binding NarL/FixJ family response regulator
MRILIIDDHPLMRDGLKTIIQTLDPRADVASQPSLSKGQDWLRNNAPVDLVLLDLGLPDTRGTESVKALKASDPKRCIVVISATSDQATIFSCLDSGASGFIPKTSSNDILISALRLILNGGVYVPSEAVKLRGAINRPVSPAMSVGLSDLAGQLSSIGLTERQLEVLDLIVKGLPNKSICRQLNLAEGTVKVHVSAILKALGVQTRTQAVVAAGKLGFGG